MQRLHNISSKLSTTKQNSQKFIIIFGAPGVGKGTYTKMLMKDFNFNHISTGDEIRKLLSHSSQNSKSNPALESIAQTLKAGGLINDNVIMEIINQKVLEPESSTGILLDGFPRTKAQFHSFLSNYKRIDLVINLKLKSEILISKLLGRLACEKCGTGYNICDIKRDGYVMPPILPKTEGVCDKCGGALRKREDDTHEIISKRMEEYEAKTRPLLNEFKEMKIVIDWEPKRGVDDYGELKNIVTSALDGSYWKKDKTATENN